MKVLMFSLDRAALRPGSPQAAKMLLYGGMFKELHVVVFEPDRSAPSSLALAPNIWLYPTRHQFKYNPFYFIKAFRIARAIALTRHFESKCDIITAQDSFPTGIPAYCTARLLGLPFQLQIHIDFFKRAFLRESLWHRLYYMCTRFLAPRADGVRVVSREIAYFLENSFGIPPRKISVLPVAPNISVIEATAHGRRLSEIPARFSFVVLMMCRLVKQKGISRAIQAMELVSARHADICLFIVGSGPEDVALRRLAALYCPNAIFFAPWVDNPAQYYKAVNAFLLVSFYEGWGLTVPEAMAAGLPVIATSVGCVPELIVSDQSGIILESGNPFEIADAICRLRENPQLCEVLAAGALRVARGRLKEDAARYATDYKGALAHAIAYR